MTAVEYYLATDANKKFRKSMEDADKVITPFVKELSYFAVFDGHAGPACAQQAAAKLHTILGPELEREPVRSRALRNAFVEMDRQFNNVYNSGCTACVALIGAKQLSVANVGDTRAVLNRDGKALRLTYDHKGSDENEKQRITNNGGLLINNRVNGVLAVTRALGDMYMKDYVVGEPYTTETTLDPLDKFLIIACDGLWDVCSDQQAVEIVEESGVEQGASELLSFALEQGSTDNLTVVVVRVAVSTSS